MHAALPQHFCKWTLAARQPHASRRHIYQNAAQIWPTNISLWSWSLNTMRTSVKNARNGWREALLRCFVSHLDTVVMTTGHRNNSFWSQERSEAAEELFHPWKTIHRPGPGGLIAVIMRFGSHQLSPDRCVCQWDASSCTPALTGLIAAWKLGHTSQRHWPPACCPPSFLCPVVFAALAQETVFHVFADKPGSQTDH